MFADRLHEAIKRRNNPTVAGLDPKFDYLPESLRLTYIRERGKSDECYAAAILRFNKDIVDAIYDVVPAVKPQLAYYEQYGLPGMKAFDETVRYAKSKGLIVLADGKRNDIGSTAEMYAAAFLGETAFSCDALTVNGYLGSDGILPFVKSCEKRSKGIFVLVKTSNPSSGELQDLILADGRRLYEAMASLVDEWGRSTVGDCGFSSVGAVVGATWPDEARALRALMPRAFFLVPGYGAQGGTADDATASFTKEGKGALVNASRSILCAYRTEQYEARYHNDYAGAARAEALRMRDDLNQALERQAARRP